MKGDVEFPLFHTQHSMPSSPEAGLVATSQSFKFGPHLLSFLQTSTKSTYLKKF